MLEGFKSRVASLWASSHARKLLAELFVVAIGVVLGLTATEAVSQWKDDREVAIAQEALNEELSFNYDSIEYRQSINACVSQRVTVLRAWLDRTSGSVDAALPGGIGRPDTALVDDTVWNVTQSGQIASKMPLRKRLDYAFVYGALKSWQAARLEERESWLEIAELAGIPLDQRLRARLAALIDRIEGQNLAGAGNDKGLVDHLVRLGVRPASASYAQSPNGKLFCRPLTAPTGGTAR